MSEKAERYYLEMAAGRCHSRSSSVRKQLEKHAPKVLRSAAAKPGTSLSVNTMLLLNASSVKY